MSSVEQPSRFGPYLSVELLMRLGQVTNHRFDVDQLRQLLGRLERRAERDPMAHLAIAAEGLGLRLNPIRMALSKAVWEAEQDTPVVLWSHPEERYLIISHASAFKVRLATYDSRNADSITVSRSELAGMLGLKHVDDEVEAGIVHALSPEESASIWTEKQEEALATRHATQSNKRSHGHHEHDHLPPFKRFVQMLKPERRDIGVMLLFALFAGLLSLALPLAVDSVVANLAFGAQTKPYVQALVILAVVLTLFLSVQALIIGFQYFVAELIQRRIFVRTAGDLAFRLPRVRTPQFDGIHGPELVNRFLDVVTVQKNTAFFLLEGVNLVVSSLFGMILLSFYHPLLAIFVLILIALIISVIWILSRNSVRTAIYESRSKYDLVSWFEEVAAFPCLFKGPGGSEMAYQRTNILATEYIHARRKHFSIVLRLVGGLLFLSIIASVSLLLLATWLVLSQQITLGQLVASEIIMSGIVSSLVKFGKKLEAWYDTMAATDKLGHIFDLDTEEETGESPAGLDARRGMQVEASGISFGYTSHQLFDGKSFVLEPGRRVGLHGKQGSGVSTLLDLLFVVRHPTSGHIAFDGLDGRNWRLTELREHVQLLRRDEFIDGSIIDNLRLGRNDIAIDEIRDALDEVGILSSCLEHPDGLDLRLRVGGPPLSASQRVSLLVARALVQRPRLLLIDELLDGLHETTFERLSQVVLGGEHPWTVVIATRMPELLARCDTTIRLTSLDSDALPLES